MRIGLAGIDSSHAEDFLRLVNTEARHPGMRITGIWGGDATRTGQLLAHSADVWAAPALLDLIGAVDAVIVGDRDGDLHRAHVLPCLAAGRPVFVDKPLAIRRADAEAMVSASQRLAVPILSGSALRWQAETARIKARLADAQGPLALSAYGTWYPDNAYGGAIFYAIHTIELVLELLGSEWQDLVRLPGADPTFRLRIGDATAAIQFRPLVGDASAFGVEIATPQAVVTQPIPLGDDYMAPVVDRFVDMLRTGRSPMSSEELLAPVALMDRIAALLAVPA